MSNPGAAAAVKIADGKREEFRRYLEEAGVMEVLSKTLAQLLDDTQRPDDALAFIAGNLGVSQQGRPTTDALQNQLSDMRIDNQRLRNENEQLKVELSKLKQQKRLSSVNVAFGAQRLNFSSSDSSLPAAYPPDSRVIRFDQSPTQPVSRKQCYAPCSNVTTCISVAAQEIFLANTDYGSLQKQHQFARKNRIKMALFCTFDYEEQQLVAYDLIMTTLAVICQTAVYVLLKCFICIWEHVVAYLYSYCRSFVIVFVK